jgi:hypothetical protein
MQIKRTDILRTFTKKTADGHADQEGMGLLLQIDLYQPHLGQSEAEGRILRTAHRKESIAAAVPPSPISGFGDQRLSGPSKLYRASGCP